MKCDQCERNAFYDVDRRHLCIPCTRQAEEIVFFRQLLLMAQSNQTQDLMETQTGVRLGGGRYPVEAIAAARRGPVTRNNISISNASVGVVNTGDMANINSLLTVAEGSDIDELGLAIKSLTQAVLDSKEIEAAQKREIVGLINGLSQQVTTSRSKSVTMAIVQGLEKKLRPFKALLELATQVVTLVESIRSWTA